MRRLYIYSLKNSTHISHVAWNFLYYLILWKLDNILRRYISLASNIFISKTHSYLKIIIGYKTVDVSTRCHSKVRLPLGLTIRTAKVVVIVVQ